MKRITLLLTTCLFFSTYVLTKAYSSETIAVNDTTIQGLSPFPFGCAVTIKYIDSTEYRIRAIEEYGSITPIGAMKMTRLRPTQDSFDFTDADYLVDFAEQYGKRFHGHTLIWGKVPDWLTEFEGDSAAWENIMKEHILTVVGRYKGRVESWDVVNEAIDDDGNIKPDNIWTLHLGEGYIERAFIYAHEADPDALLFYNDYGHEYSNKRLTAITNMLINLKEKGIPVHGIGMQMHTRYNLGDERWKNAIEVAATTGLKVHISELDIALNPEADPELVLTPELSEIQRQKYKYMVQAYNSLPDDQKHGITTWGIGDKDSWLKDEKGRPDWPLPFDENYERKPAYYGIIEGFEKDSTLSLVFDNPLTDYVTFYEYPSGDVIYFSQGRNSSTSDVCEGSEGSSLTNRVQEHSFTIEAKSSPIFGLSIYGKSSSNAERIINKIEISDTKEGEYTDITESAEVTNSMLHGDCGILSAKNLDISKGMFVRISITLPDQTTSAPTNISEILINTQPETRLVY